MEKAVIYARVSSDRQEKEGFSIPAQIDFLKDYGSRHSFLIDKIFAESETAKKAGRKAFNEMLSYIKKQGIRVVLVEKTDRLYRNFKDYITLEEYDLDIHLVKENTVISKNSKSHDKFIHGIKVLMAKNYIDNLSEEVQKGLNEKVKQGHYPCKPPIGYKNQRIDGKSIIVVDNEKASYIKRMFELYASGYSIERIREVLTAEGLNNNGKPYAKSRFGELLHNVFYIGKFIYRDVVYDGAHEPLISIELFNKVQKMFEQTKPRSQTLEFDYAGLIKCGHCGCQLTAELKKGKYIYYHCTGNRGGDCKRDFVRQEEIEEVLTELVKRVAKSIPDDILAEIKLALKEMQVVKTRYEENSQAEIMKQVNLLKKRIDNLYIDKLDGKISEEFWHEKNSEWHAQKNELLNKLQILNNSSKNFYEGSNLLLNFCKEAPARFLAGTPQTKRQIINLLCSNLYYKDGKLSVEMKSAFDFLLKSASSYMVDSTGRHWNSFIKKLVPFITSELIEEIKLIA